MERENAVLATYGLSWVAYVRPLVVAVFFALVGGFISIAFEPQWSAVGIEKQWVAVAAGVLAVLWLVYQVLYIRSVRLYTNETGVWLYQGVFPWQKGIFGVKWRDVDGAAYHKGFISWICRSYVVQVGHRYTKANELVVPHVGKGHQFVEHVNQEHQAHLQTLGDEDSEPGK